MSSIKNKFSYQLLLSASQVVLPLVLYPYISRVLGPQNLGKINYADFVAQLFTILGSFGIPFYAVREIAITRDNPMARAKLIKELSALQLIFALLSLLLFYFFTAAGYQSEPVLYTAAGINIFACCFTYDWYLQGMELFRLSSLRTIAIRTLVLVASFLLVKNAGDYNLYYIIITGGSIAVILVNISVLLKQNNFSAGQIDIKKHLVPLWHFFITASAIGIYVYFDTIILKQITGSEIETGFYSTALKLVKVFVAVIITLGAVMLPRISSLANEGRRDEIITYHNKMLQLVITAGIPVCTGILIAAPEIIRLLAGDQFLPSIPVTRILAFLPLVIWLSNIFCFQVLVPYRQERKIVAAVVTGCIVSISSNLLLTSWYAAKGAAWAAIFTELTVTCITGYYAHKLIPFKIDKSVLWQTIVACLLFIPLVFACRQLPASAVVILVLSVLSCSLCYFTLQYFIFKNPVIKDIKEYIESLLKL